MYQSIKNQNVRVSKVETSSLNYFIFENKMQSYKIYAKTDLKKVSFFIIFSNMSQKYLK